MCLSEKELNKEYVIIQYTYIYIQCIYIYVITDKLNSEHSSQATYEDILLVLGLGQSPFRAL